MTRIATALLAVMAAIWCAEARAETVVAALSEKRVDIRSNFVGTELILFGSIERDAATVGRAHGYDVIVVIEGPASELVTRQKKRFAGIWINGAGIEFRAAPSYYAVLSNRLLTDISGTPTLRRNRIGLEHMKLQALGDEPAETVAIFRDALLRRKEAQDLYFEKPDAVEFLTPSLFMARIPLPANITTGGYRAQVHVFGDGALLTTAKLGFWVIKSGFEAAIHQLAERRPLIYGLGTVAMAFGVGWLGSILFRRS